MKKFKQLKLRSVAKHGILAASLLLLGLMSLALSTITTSLSVFGLGLLCTLGGVFYSISCLFSGEIRWVGDIAHWFQSDDK
jgi:uncharacterized membrane protein HdeD (DUF308 family)